MRKKETPALMHLRALVNDVVRESSDHPLHRTLDGTVVPLGCEACILDMEERIQDMTQSRDEASHGAAERDHYNGILRVLRRKLRSANKIHTSTLGEQDV